MFSGGGGLNVAKMKLKFQAYIGIYTDQVKHRKI